MTQRDDINLVRQLKSNDINAFNALFQKYSQNLYRFSFSMLKNREDSEEIVQEAFLRIWNNRSKIDTDKSFKAYLFKISYNLIMNQLKQRLKDEAFLIHLEQYFGTKQMAPPDVVDYMIIQNRINSIVEELPEKRKQIFRLSREDGLSHKEIAKKLDISVKTVENQIGLVLKQLKSKLGNEYLPVLLFLSLFT